jgi:hypothetical protein
MCVNRGLKYDCAMDSCVVGLHLGLICPSGCLPSISSWKIIATALLSVGCVAERDPSGHGFCHEAQPYPAHGRASLYGLKSTRHGVKGRVACRDHTVLPDMLLWVGFGGQAIIAQVPWPSSDVQNSRE